MKVSQCQVCKRPRIQFASAWLRKKAEVCACTAQPSELEELFLAAWRASGGPEPEREQKLIDGRRFRADFSWPAHEVSLEIDGMVHRIAGRFKSDVEKSNLTQLNGWVYLRATGEMLRRDPGGVCAMVRRAMG